MKDMLNTAVAVYNDSQSVDAASRFHFRAAICPLAGKIMEDLYLNKTTHINATYTPSCALHAVSQSLAHFLEASSSCKTGYVILDLLRLNVRILV